MVILLGSEFVCEWEFDFVLVLSLRSRSLLWTVMVLKSEMLTSSMNERLSSSRFLKGPCEMSVTTSVGCQVRSVGLHVICLRYLQPRETGNSSWPKSNNNMCRCTRATLRVWVDTFPTNINVLVQCSYEEGWNFEGELKEDEAEENIWG